ncbi:gp53-like domain-containing protein [Yersinia rohdei]|uniref:gp53-like domain-containing protein n=1 Tax=Yersinia rohdei TaxID=29485 RepID=UPI0025AACF95|nr:hypothetical protein [Yersinia rohdei]MDN0095841.1 hypothetical protein [Yersinia rohdei]
MSWYKAGAVTSVAGTNIITGTGTLWSNPIFGIAPGQMIFVPGAGQVVIYEILAIDSDTRIRITSNSTSSITDSEYAIVTTVSNSMSDLARRTALHLALYQGLLQDWQQITTGTGNVTIIAPDGTEVIIPSLSQMAQDISGKVSAQQLTDGLAGKAASGANRDITSLSSLTTALSIAQGGTGANTAVLARTALELGTAATRNIGSGTNQIPDMSLFNFNSGVSGYQILPSGLILQWGTVTTTAANTFAAWTFPIPFPNVCRTYFAMTENGGGAPYYAGRALSSLITKTQALVSCNYNGTASNSCLAIGY